MINHLDLEKGIFHEWNESSSKVFKEAVNFVKEKKEIIERKKIFQKRRGGARGGLFLYKGEGFAFYSMARKSISKSKNKDYWSTKRWTSTNQDHRDSLVSVGIMGTNICSAIKYIKN